MPSKFLALAAGALASLVAAADLASAGNSVRIYTNNPSGTTVYTNDPRNTKVYVTPNAHAMIPNMFGMLGAYASAPYAYAPAAPAAAPADLKLSFGCEVAGTPVEYPDDIRITNPYSFAIGAGVKVAYAAPYGHSGEVLLPAMAPGQSIYVDGAVEGGLAPGVSCTAVQK